MKILIMFFLLVSSISFAQSIPDSTIFQLKQTIEDNNNKISKELENTSIIKSETKGKLEGLSYASKGDTNLFKVELTKLDDIYNKAIDQEEYLKKLLQQTTANLNLLNYFIETYMKNPK